jgi:hypothetical protein
MGGPRDHPITDVLVHGLATFGPVADDMVREIDALGGRQWLCNRIERRGIGYRADHSTDDVQLVAELTAMRDELQTGRRLHTTFGPSLDATLAQIIELGGEAELLSRFDALGIDTGVSWTGTPELPGTFVLDLSVLLERLRNSGR